MSNRELAALEVSLPVTAIDVETDGFTTEPTTVDNIIETKQFYLPQTHKSILIMILST